MVLTIKGDKGPSAWWAYIVTVLNYCYCMHLKLPPTMPTKLPLLPLLLLSAVLHSLVLCLILTDWRWKIETISYAR